MSEISGVTFNLLEKLLCFTDVDLTSTSIKHSVRNFEYRTDQKQSIGACMTLTKLRGAIQNKNVTKSGKSPKGRAFSQEKLKSGQAFLGLNRGKIWQKGDKIEQNRGKIGTK